MVERGLKRGKKDVEKVTGITSEDDKTHDYDNDCATVCICQKCAKFIQYNEICLLAN